MGLLVKTNPTATRESVIRHAIISSFLAAIVYLIAAVWTPALLDYWLILLPVAMTAGAALGALMEWQLDDGVEIYWIVLEVEEAFGIKIPEAAWTEIHTVGDLLNVTLDSLRAQRPSFANDIFSESEVWERLKTLLISQLGLKPEQVAKSAGFYDLGL